MRARHDLNLLQQAQVRRFDLQHNLVAILTDAQEPVEDPVSVGLHRVKLRQIYLIQPYLGRAGFAPSAIDPPDFFACASKVLPANVLQDSITSCCPRLLACYIGSLCVVPQLLLAWKHSILHFNQITEHHLCSQKQCINAVSK